MWFVLTILDGQMPWLVYLSRPAFFKGNMHNISLLNFKWIIATYYSNYHLGQKRNSCPFYWHSTSNPGILKLLFSNIVEKNKDLTSFSISAFCDTAFENCCILPIRYLSIRHYYIRHCEIIRILEKDISIWNMI